MSTHLSLTVSPLHPFMEKSVKPILQAFELQKKGGILKEIGARALFIAQIVVSIIAIPILLLIGIFNAAFLALSLEGKKSLKTLQEMGKTVTLHLALFLPMSIVGLFTTKEITQSAGEPMSSFSEALVELWDCKPCQSDNSRARAYSSDSEE